MSPENIEQLKQLKQLLDDGVLTAEEFALQKSLILAPPQNPELAKSEGQSGIFGPRFSSTDSIKANPDFETSSREDKYAVMRGLLASGALQAKDFSQETLSLVYGKQVDGSSKKEQNSRRVEGNQGASTTRPVSNVDPIREMHIRMNLPSPVTKTAASTSKSVTSNTKKLVLTFSAIILVVLVVLVSVIAGGSNDSAKEGDAGNSSVEVSTPDNELPDEDEFIYDVHSLYDKFIPLPDEKMIETGYAICVSLRNGVSSEQVVTTLLVIAEGDADIEDLLKKVVASALKNFCPDQHYKFSK